ncbi:hypothetical protein VCRA2128O99_320037 [Vibrio crassostreae]|nr:hypothetical protein VCRA2128O103_290012 [Vibrio crassostreae]CAK3951439.1 hypothetical protein VCRA2128O99_320037 [Vibrio crassostreae]CDT71915.1 hypothetical protein VCR20J5_790003 [Vibrio crassostreae]
MSLGFRLVLLGQKLIDCDCGLFSETNNGAKVSQKIPSA